MENSPFANGQLVGEILIGSGTHMPQPISSGVCHDWNQKKAISGAVRFLKGFVHKTSMITKDCFHIKEGSIGDNLKCRATRETSSLVPGQTGPILIFVL